MQLKVNSFKIPEPITFNYEELKTDLIEKAKVYESLVFTEDQIKEAKKYRADLNALKKALNDERIRQEKDWMVPFNQFKSQIAEIIKIIDKPCEVIDKQIKAFEEKQKEEKKKAIYQLVGEVGFPVTLDLVFDSKWLNSTVSLETIKKQLTEKKNIIIQEMHVLDDLDEFKFECQHIYLKTLNLSAALEEHHKLKEQALAKAKWEAEQKATAEAAVKPSESVSEKAVESVPVEEEIPADRQWIRFQAYLSMDEAKKLGAFLRENGIKYKAI